MKALGILNFEPSSVYASGLEEYRPISAASFLGRYRVLDFMISNFTNSGINDIQVYIKNHPRSTVEHVTSTSYNINNKRGHILMLTGEKVFENPIYNTDIASFIANRKFIEDKKEEYVIIAPSHFIFIQDFDELLDKHIESGNDISLLYQSISNANKAFELCTTLKFNDEGYVERLVLNNGKYKHRDLWLECAILSRKLFLELITKAQQTSSLYWFKDILDDQCENLKVGAFPHHGYVACMNTLKAYFKSQIELRKMDNFSSIISPKWPIYTKTNDTCPTLYEGEGKAISSLVGNGCLIHGEVKNSIIGRDTKIGKGAVVDHCVLLPDSIIGDGVHISYAVVDRYASVSLVKDIKGSEDSPLYVRRDEKI